MSSSATLEVPAPSAPSRTAASLPHWSVPILAYHRVGEPRRDHVPTVTPDAFEAQLRWMRRMGFRGLSLDELVNSLAAGTPISRRSVAITFDDGYEETYSVVLPLLQR